MSNTTRPCPSSSSLPPSAAPCCRLRYIRPASPPSYPSIATWGEAATGGRRLHGGLCRRGHQRHTLLPSRGARLQSVIADEAGALAADADVAVQSHVRSPVWS